MTLEILLEDFPTLPDGIRDQFTSYYEGSPAARLRTISSVVDMEVTLTQLKHNFQTIRVHRKERGKVIREFVVRLLG